jgi:hypothetical protein
MLRASFDPTGYHIHGRPNRREGEGARTERGVPVLINAIEGFVENGQIRLRETVTLPEHAKVYVIVANEQVDRLVRPDDRAARIHSPRLAHPEQAKDFAKQVVEPAPDAKL